MRYRPDVFLVDHAPAGMKGELRKALAFIREEMPATQSILGLRDIIDSPEAVRSLWRKQNIYQLLETAYDQILVYGCRHLFDSVRAYDFPAAVAAKTRYCGYIVLNDSNVQAMNRLRVAPPTSGRPVILVTVGGGGDGYALLSAYLRALDCFPHDVAQSIIVPGPLMALEERRAIELAAVERPDVRMIFFSTELAALIRSADLVVAMAGYNTTAEILVAKKPAILVPRGAPRMEQRMRAKLMSNLGLAWVIQPEENLVTRLAELIQGALAGARPPRNCWNAVDLEGVHRVGNVLDDRFGRRARRPAKRDMTQTPPRAIGYMLKRYPRLSETFILNEMRALERLGTHLHVFSLMRPEEALSNPAVMELHAPVTYLPETLTAKIRAVARAHATMAWTVPGRYLQAAGLALWWSLQSRRPLSICKQFLRSGFMAVACREQHIRHLHAHFANAPAIVARLVSVMRDIPYSFSTHAKDLYLIRQKAMRQRIGSASFVLTCTRHNVEYLQSFLPQREWHKIHLVYHGIDLAEFPFLADNGKATTSAAAVEPVIPIEVSVPLILSVGRLVPKKGLNDLISACQLMKARGLNFRCAIVGEGPLRGELEGQISQLGLEDTVALLGAMAHDRLVSFYGQASIFALCPRVMEDGDRDGIPNVLAEAMAAGLPVVSTRVSGIPELVEDRRTGLLVGSKNPAALADAVETLLKDPDKRQSLVVAARRKVENSFECWETTKAVQTLLQVGASR
jgi:predicted glycosyltransferase/glycosyltransferase involved in cell wall biosynthesis